MSKYELQRHRYFDFNSAKEDVWYTLHKEQKGLFGKAVLVPVTTQAFDMGGSYKLPVRGDLKWAKAIAKELKIEVPRV